MGDPGGAHRFVGRHEVHRGLAPGPAPRDIAGSSGTPDLTADGRIEWIQPSASRPAYYRNRT